MKNWIASNRAELAHAAFCLAIYAAFAGPHHPSPAAPPAQVFSTTETRTLVATLPKPPRSCYRRPPTIFGTAQPDILLGTAGNDVVFAGRSGDTVFALSGRDRLCGGTGDDDLDGGLGYDRAHGNKGADACEAEKRQSC